MSWSGFGQLVSIIAATTGTRQVRFASEGDA
jgi:hypothetical protein